MIIDPEDAVLLETNKNAEIMYQRAATGALLDADGHFTVMQAAKEPYVAPLDDMVDFGIFEDDEEDDEALAPTSAADEALIPDLDGANLW